jgi:threonine dehydrogenase-like Zn-dependent dehydrogenase
MNQTAIAAYMTGVNQPLDIREYPLTKPGPGMALLKLIASGVCGTDLHILRGLIPVGTPLALGHEFVGRIAEISAQDSADTGLAAGDAVIATIACPCFGCKLCVAGDDANCINMGLTNGGNPEAAPHFHGGFGQYNYSPVKNLIKIPESLDPQAVCVFACAGPTIMHAAHLAGLAGCDLSKAETAVVQGLGPVGFFAVLYLAALGIPRVIAVSAHAKPERDALAVKIGATEVIAAAESGGITGADVAVEASGNPAAFAQGLAMLRNRGVYLVPGQYSNSGAVPVEPQTITFKALHIIGSSQYSTPDIGRYLDFLVKHPRLHETISSLAACYAVGDANQAIEDAGTGRNIKTLLI